jgi:hypothetical protein
MGDLVLKDEGTPPKGGRYFRYVRYNADLSPSGLEKLGVDPKLAPAVQQMDAVDQIDNMRSVGRAVAQSEVSLGHLGSFVQD